MITEEILGIKNPRSEIINTMVYWNRRKGERLDSECGKTLSKTKKR